MSYTSFAPSQALVLVALVLGACRTPDPMPRKLRGTEFELVRVDGQRVRGSLPFKAKVGSYAAKVECQDHVADGYLSINPDGRTFRYRSAWRDCGGGELVSEANEGSIEMRDDHKLALLIQGPDGVATFLGAYTDSTIVIYELGGRLEFVRR